MADQITTSLAQAKVLVMQGMAGKAPRVNATNNHWEVYNNDSQTWVDTGVAATGAKGDDGYTPVVTASETTGGVFLTISDGRPSGVINTYFIRDGAAGADGEDGYSPEVTISSVNNGHRVKITDAEHPNGQSFDVMDGFNGTNGTNGADGYSPTVTITNITGGHRVNITDKTHPNGQNFDVMDGEGIPDDSLALNGQVLGITTQGPRWVTNIPGQGAALRLLYDGAFDPVDDPELMLTANIDDLDTGYKIVRAIVGGTIGSAALVDVTSPNDVKAYDLYAYDYANDIVVFARTEDALIRTATLSGSTKTAPVFGTIPLVGGLPTVTAADNGKVLKVVNGVWTAVAE